MNKTVKKIIIGVWFHSKRNLYEGLEAYYLKSYLVVLPEKREHFNWLRWYVSGEYYENNYLKGERLWKIKKQQLQL